MAAMAPSSPPPTRPARTSIANLLHHPLDPERNLIHLSHLASSLAPSTPPMSRTRSVPHHAHPHPRRSAAPSSAAPSHLRITTPSSKRLSRTRSGLTPTARRMLASAAAAAAANANAAATATTADHPTTTATSTAPAPPSPLVLRPLSANPCLRDGVEIASHALTALSRAHRAPTTPEPDRMLLDDPVHDASCSSHDNNAGAFLAGPSSSIPAHRSSTNNMHQLHAAGASNHRSQRSPPPPVAPSATAPVRTRSRTTPDAKRAQNRESAKRFRMAQKKRWEQLQNTVTRKDAEIARLKRMLQEVTNTQEQTTRQHAHRPNSMANVETQPVADGARGDALSRAELELFVKLLWAPPHHADQSDSQHSSSVNAADGSSGGGQQVLPPMAANLGCLHRVIVAKVDGSVLGIRHQNDQRGRAMGAEVGGCIWEHVDSADSLHLRCSIVHASKLAAMFDGHLNVFSYRRRKHVATQNDSDGAMRVEYIRMKGCVYPLPDQSGAITRVLLAEFIEL